MRIYSNARELMSEMGRDLWEMGLLNRPKTYQNKDISQDENMVTKEEICKQYCLTELPDPDYLFVYTHTLDWANEEFKERISGPINPGNAWKLNPGMWEEFLVDTDKGKKFDYTYAERFNRINSVSKNMEMSTVLKDVVKLLKDDPDTRKAIIPIFTGEDTKNYDGKARIPCSMYYDLLIRDCGQGKQLNLMYHQRSSDFVGHFGDDVYLAWCMMEHIAKEVGVKAGFLYHTIDSLHCYKRDWHLLKTSIDELI